MRQWEGKAKGRGQEVDGTDRRRRRGRRRRREGEHSLRSGIGQNLKTCGGHRLPRFSLSSVKQGQQSARCRAASRLGKHRAHSAPCAVCDILCLVNELHQHFLDAFFLLLTTTFLGGLSSEMPSRGEEWGKLGGRRGGT